MRFSKASSPPRVKSPHKRAPQSRLPSRPRARPPHSPRPSRRAAPCRARSRPDLERQRPARRNDSLGFPCISTRTRSSTSWWSTVASVSRMNSSWISLRRWALAPSSSPGTTRLSRMRKRTSGTSAECSAKVGQHRLVRGTLAKPEESQRLDDDFVGTPLRRQHEGLFLRGRCATRPAAGQQSRFPAGRQKRQSGERGAWGS